MSQKPIETSAVSLAEAGKILGYRDPSTITRLIASGQLHGFRARTASGLGAWRVTTDSIAKFMMGDRWKAEDESRNAAISQPVTKSQQDDSRIAPISQPEIKSLKDR